MTGKRRRSVSRCRSSGVSWSRRQASKASTSPSIGWTASSSRWSWWRVSIMMSRLTRAWASQWPGSPMLAPSTSRPAASTTAPKGATPGPGSNQPSTRPAAWRLVGGHRRAVALVGPVQGQPELLADRVRSHLGRSDRPGVDGIDGHHAVVAGDGEGGVDVPVAQPALGTEQVAAGEHRRSPARRGQATKIEGERGADAVVEATVDLGQAGQHRQVRVQVEGVGLDLGCGEDVGERLSLTHDAEVGHHGPNADQRAAADADPTQHRLDHFPAEQLASRVAAQLRDHTIDDHGERGQALALRQGLTGEQDDGLIEHGGNASPVGGGASKGTGRGRSRQRRVASSGTIE